MSLSYSSFFLFITPGMNAMSDLLGRLFVLFTSDPGDGGRQGSLSPFPHIHYTLLMKCASGNEHWGLASVVIALIFTPDADKTRQCMYGRIDVIYFSRRFWGNF